MSLSLSRRTLTRIYRYRYVNSILPSADIRAVRRGGA